MLSEDELAGVPLLVFCNKQDVEGALKPEEISEQLGLAGGEKGRDWSVRGSCAVQGEGIEEGLDWCVTINVQALITKMCFQACQRYTKEIGRPQSNLLALIISSIRFAVEKDNVIIVFFYHSSHCIVSGLDFQVLAFESGWHNTSLLLL